MSFLRSTTTWLRLTFRWSNSSQTWHERVGDLGLLLGLLLATTISLIASLEWWQLLLVWGICLLPALAFGAVGWLKLFGPVLYYDMIRQSRRSRFIILRFLYALLLVFLFFCVSMSVTNMHLSRTDTHMAADIAQHYFEVFMVAQFIMVVLLTPAYVGGAISDEKDRKTLEFMLATDLLNREIVLSKLGSRLANLALVVLTGLPILSVMQFLGGVDPNLVLAGFALTALTVVGLAAVSIFCSTICKKPRESIALSYLAVVVYYAVAGVAALAIYTTGIDRMPIWTSDNAPTYADVLGYFNKGNLVSAIVAIKAAADLGTLAATLPAVVGSYAITYGIITVASVGLAIARLRRVALAQTYGKAIKARVGLRIWNRPPVGPFPMFWKEINCEGGHRSPWLAWIIFAILLILTFLWPVVAVIRHWLDFYQEVRPWNNLASEMNIWVCFCNVIVGYLTLFAIGIRASTSITTEREKQTFDTLLTTPMDSGAILSAKWTGSLLGVRFGILWLLMVWATGIVTGGLHLVSLLFAVVAWTIYACFAATLGLWFSVTSKSSLRATVWTIAMLIITGVGHWLIWACCGPMLAFSYSPGTDKIAQYLAKAQAGILTPGFVMVWSVLSSEDSVRSGDYWNKEWWEMTIFSLVGLVGWSIASAVLYSVTSARFRKLTHREEFMSADNNTEERRRQRELRSATPISPWAPPTGSPPVEEPEDGIDDEPEEFRYRP